MTKTTKAQRRAIYRKYKQNPDGAASYREFRQRAVAGYDCIMFKWRGMFIGIELDGYTHS